MSNLVNRLSALHVEDPSSVTDAVVAADLERGRQARSSRRRRRSVVAGVASVGLVALSSAAYLASTEHRSGATRAAASSVVVPPTVAPTVASSVAMPTTIELVAYHGNQFPGYTVKTIPAGYVLQGSSAATLDIAKQGDRSALDSFVGKIVVMLNDRPGTDVGELVSVNGRPGRIVTEDGVLTLSYSDGVHNVQVQCWRNIRITKAQLVHFAEGITVLKNAQVSHG